MRTRAGSGQDLDLLEELLGESARASGQVLEPNARTTLAHYANRVAHWNRTANLTGARDAEDFCRRFLGDVFAVAPHIEGDSLVDVGSGNGLPGLVLAVLKPESRVWLVEPRARRARFLRQMQIELGLDQVEVVEARVEDWRAGIFPAAIVAQAVGDLDYLLQVTRHLHGPACRLYALKGHPPSTELAALGARAAACTTTRLEVAGWQERHLVTIECDRLDAI